MRVERLGHVNIRTPDFARTVAFYEQALGLRSSPGASARARRENTWLHDAADLPLIHVNGVEAGETVAAAGMRSRLDHFALDCAGLESCIARLRALDVPFEEMRIAARGLIQLNIVDPNGLKVELTFSDTEDGCSSGR